MNNFDIIQTAFTEYPREAIVTTLLVLLPVIGWGFAFTRRKTPGKKVIFLTFGAGIISALIMFLYQYYWETKLDFGFFELTPVDFQENIGGWVQNRLLSIFLVAMSIGLIEEYLKHWVVKKSDHNYFDSVNDVIELSIIAALGFAFTENMIYLLREIITHGMTQKFFSLFILRSLFVVFVHVLCSGIYGYYYGVGYYARPILEEDEHEGRKRWIPNFLHRLIHWKKARIFHDEMIALGLIISVVIHGLFDFFMSVNWSVGSMLGVASLEKVGIHIIVLPAYLIFGLLYLAKIFQKKRYHEHFGHLTVQKVYGEYDLKQNIEKLREVEEAVEENYRHKNEGKSEENLEENLKKMRDMEETIEDHYKNQRKDS